MMLHKGNLKKKGGSSSTRIPSTFIKYGGKIPHLAQHMLHSKSTYFYRWGSRKKLSSKVTFLLPSVCILALLVGGIVAINPTIDNGVYAINDSGNLDGGTGSGGTTEGDITPSIALSFPTEGLPEGFNNNAEQVTPVEAGEVAYRSNYFDVTVNNPSWYAVSIRAALGYTSDLVYSGTNAAAITGVGKDVPTNRFKENTWGYALTQVPTLNTEVDDSTLTYSTLPASNSPLAAEDSGYISDGTNTKHYKISFATLFSGDAPSGHYTTRVYLSAVTNPGQITALSLLDAHAMQQMTKSVCDNSQIGDTNQLTDIRDGKKYWVAKLADKNCWMTQNLDFDIPEDGKLYATTTNVASDTTLDMTEVVAINNNTANGVANWPQALTNRYLLAYYDPGLYVKKDPANAANWCDYVKQLSDSKCLQKGWIDVSNSTNYVARTTAPQGNEAYSTSSSVLDTTTTPQTYDAHYLVGNYYTYDLAAANSAAITISQGSGAQAANSICPKGWKLPTSGSLLPNSLNTYNVSGSFAYLVKQYGFIKSATDSNGTLTSGNYNIINAPLYFTYPGWILNLNNSSGQLNAAGTYGFYHSSVRAGTGGDYVNNNYEFRIDSSGIDVSASNPGAIGKSIRCVNDPSI